MHHEPHDNLTGRLGWLRAGVLCANDGIVSVAGIVVGVAGATAACAPLFTAGLAGLVDSEHALLAKERHELAESPEEELAELVALYRAKGLSQATARQVAKELTGHDPLGAHLDAELGILRVPVCVVAVLTALAILGVVSSRLGGADSGRAVLRVLTGGALGLAFTYGVGHLFGTAIG